MPNHGLSFYQRGDVFVLRRVSADGETFEWALTAIEASTLAEMASGMRSLVDKQNMSALPDTAIAFSAIPVTKFLLNRDVMQETRDYGFAKVKAEQVALGAGVRALLESRGIVSVAADGFKAPGVVVSYTTDAEIQSSKKFLSLGLQTASGVPLQCDEPADFMTFRIGLFGLEKLHNVPRSVEHLAHALDQMGIKEVAAAAA